MGEKAFFGLYLTLCGLLLYGVWGQMAELEDGLSFGGFFVLFLLVIFGFFFAQLVLGFAFLMLAWGRKKRGWLVAGAVVQLAAGTGWFALWAAIPTRMTWVEVLWVAVMILAVVSLVFSKRLVE